MLCDLRSFTVIIFTLSTLLFDLYNLRVYKKSFLYAVVEIDIKCELFPLKSLQVHMWIKTLKIVVRTLHGVLNKNYNLKDCLSFCNCIWKPFFNWISRFSLTKEITNIPSGRQCCLKWRKKINHKKWPVWKLTQENIISVFFSDAITPPPSKKKLLWFYLDINALTNHMFLDSLRT